MVRKRKKEEKLKRKISSENLHCLFFFSLLWFVGETESKLLSPIDRLAFSIEICANTSCIVILEKLLMANNFEKLSLFFPFRLRFCYTHASLEL